MAFFDIGFWSGRNLSNADLRDGVSRLAARAEAQAVQSAHGYKRSPWVLDDRPLRREKAMGYVPFARSINLIASQCAEVIANTARVVDMTGDVITTEQSKRALAFLQHSPDGVHNAQAWLKDLFFDLLIEGNAVVYAVPVPMSDGATKMRSRLVRLNALSASARISDHSMGWPSLVYQGTPYGIAVTYDVYSHRDIIHVKYEAPNLQRTTSSDEALTFDNSDLKFNFSPAPVTHLSKAIKIGIEADNWVGDFFDNAAKNNMVVSFPQDMSLKDQKAFLKYWRKTETNHRYPILGFGGAQVSVLNQTPQEAEAKELREYQVQEVARYYGIPAPLIGSHVTQWGSGIEQLARLFYRYGLRFPLGQFLDAFSFRLLPKGQRFEVDSLSEVKGDMSAMTALLSAARPGPNGPATISRREMRAMLGLYGDMDDDWDYEPEGSEVDKSDSEKQDNPPSPFGLWRGGRR